MPIFSPGGTTWKRPGGPNQDRGNRDGGGGPGHGVGRAAASTSKAPAAADDSSAGTSSSSQTRSKKKKRVADLGDDSSGEEFRCGGSQQPCGSSPAASGTQGKPKLPPPTRKARRINLNTVLSRISSYKSEGSSGPSGAGPSAAGLGSDAGDKAYLPFEGHARDPRGPGGDDKDNDLYVKQGKDGIIRYFAGFKGKEGRSYKYGAADDDEDDEELSHTDTVTIRNSDSSALNNTYGTTSSSASRVNSCEASFATARSSFSATTVPDSSNDSSGDDAAGRSDSSKKPSSTGTGAARLPVRPTTTNSSSSSECKFLCEFLPDSPGPSGSKAKQGPGREKGFTKDKKFKRKNKSSPAPESPKMLMHGHLPATDTDASSDHGEGVYSSLSES